jgi:hypothetical protein
MLTETQYQDLWTRPFLAGGFAMPIGIIPSYHQYLKR